MVAIRKSQRDLELPDPALITTFAYPIRQYPYSIREGTQDETVVL